MATVITNNQPRETISWFELTEKERADFDYLDAEAQSYAHFVRYRGEVYDLGQFVVQLDHGKWDGIHTDTYFSGILIRWPDHDDAERVIMGRVYS